MLKVQLSNTISWSGHRSGWRYVLDLLRPYNSKEGILTDGFLDATFGFRIQENQYKKNIPYNKDWIGFWHHPICIPPWLDEKNLAPAFILQKEDFQASLPFCKGIFTFSNYLSSYLRDRLDIPVETLLHPTECTDKTFDFDAFLKSKQLLQVGSWLRKLTSFYCFEAPNYKKLHLLGKSSLKYLKLELEHNSDKNFNLDNVRFLSYLNNKTYDLLLSESIVFIDLYDSSVNNTVIECIVRNVPILVNKIKPVIEYLGEEYPLYYEELDEIPEIIKDLDLINASHQYLKKLSIKEKLRGEFFLHSFKTSCIISSLERGPKV